MKSFLTILIRGYQWVLSPDYGLAKVFYPYGCCRYYPTCSEYAAQAIKKYGFYGLWLSGRRLSPRPPRSSAGIDPPV